MVTQDEARRYIDGLIKHSSHIYVGTAAECRAMEQQVGRPIKKLVNFACQAPFKTKHMLSILDVTYIDDDKETLLSYDDELKVRYHYSDSTGSVMFSVFDTSDDDWQVDLAVMYHHEVR